MNQNFFFFVSKYVRRHKVQILCEVFTFSPAFKFFTKVWNFKEKRKKKKACSTSDSLTTSLLDHFFFLRVFLYHRQPPEHIGVELGYVDTVWSFMCSPVQTPTSHDHMFYVCSPLHTLFYSYWIEIYYSSNTSTKKSPFGLYEKIIYWTCRPIIYNDTGSFYYFLHGYIRRRRHWVSFSFLLFFFLYVLTPYSFSGTSIKKRSCTYLWRGEEFLKTKDNWFVVNFFSPHIGENVFVGGGGGRWRRRRRRAGLWGSICTCYCLYFK